MSIKSITYIKRKILKSLKIYLSSTGSFMLTQSYILFSSSLKQILAPKLYLPSWRKCSEEAQKNILSPTEVSVTWDFDIDIDNI